MSGTVRKIGAAKTIKAQGLRGCGRAHQEQVGDAAEPEGDRHSRSTKSEIQPNSGLARPLATLWTTRAKVSAVTPAKTTASEMEIARDQRDLRRRHRPARRHRMNMAESTQKTAIASIACGV